MRLPVGARLGAGAMSRSCPSCGGPVSDQAKFCRSCGQPVPQEAPPAVEPADGERRACGACGTELFSGARFCHMCAAKAPLPPPQPVIDCPACGKELDGT